MSHRTVLSFPTHRYASGACTYALSMGGKFIEAYLHRLTDGGSLVRIINADGTTQSCVVYMREEVERYVVSVGGKTCIFDKENDPTIMRASSAGKLVRYLVEDGEHVNEVPPPPHPPHTHTIQARAVRHTHVCKYALDAHTTIYSPSR
jgi:hypothetical protein